MVNETPAAVIVANPEPVPVKVVNPILGPTGLKTQDQTIDPSLPAKTTFQEDLTFAGQRHINLIWEKTQAVIAMSVVLFTMVIATYCVVKGKDVPALIAMAFGTVVGFYFSRTNHAAIGGVGPKAVSQYEGR